MESEKSKRKVWTKNETLLLLKCYGGRKDKFVHPRKKKNAYKHVLEDMIYEGFADTTVNQASLQGKMRTLLTTYKTATDDGRQTGASASTVTYINEMDEIFGSKGMISNSHTINIGISQNAEVRHRNLQESENSNPTPPLPVSPASTLPVSIASTLPASDLSPYSPSSSSISTTNSPGPIRVRKTAKEKYFEAKISIKEKSFEEKKKQSDLLQQRVDVLIAIEKEKLECIKSLISERSSQQQL